MTQTPDFGTHYLTLGIIPNHPSLSFPRGTMGWLNQSRGFQALAADTHCPLSICWENLTPRAPSSQELVLSSLHFNFSLYMEGKFGMVFL